MTTQYQDVIYSLATPGRDQPLAFQQLVEAKKAAIKERLDRSTTLTSSAKRIWLYCSDLVSRKGEHTFLHHATIAKKLGISTKTVQRSLRNLADLGWLKYEPGAGDRGNKIWLILPVNLDE